MRRLFILLWFIPSLAFAQEFEAPIRNYTAGPEYMAMVRQAINLRPKNFYFGQLRALYTQTQHYDPIGSETLDRLMELAYTADTRPGTEEGKKALADYQALAGAHLANIDVIEQALSLARQNPAFGDSELYAWVRRGLLASLAKGDGSTLLTAYQVVTLGEEARLLSALRVRVLKSQSMASGGVRYNIHDVEDMKTGRQYAVFVDTSKPLEYLEWKRKRERTGVFSLRP